MRRTENVLVGLSLLWAACGGEQRQAGQSEGAQQGRMEGMAMRMPSTDMLPSVRAYRDSVVRAEPGELPGMVAGHRDRMEQMLAAMDQDMRAMNMTADGETLVLRMRAHAGQIRRLLEMHERMMGQMKM